ncbi:MAG: rhombosortase [Rubrivivax sp.]|nr:rhombosortase [Rubrivivax sp.]
MVCAVLAGGSVAAWWAPAALLDWQPARAVGEPWRFVTAAFVHWSPAHLVANLAGVGVVALLGRIGALPARAACALVVAWPLTHAGLWLEPALAHYGGASGVLHAAVAVAAVSLLARGFGEAAPGPRAQRHARRIGAAIAAGLAAKVLLERPWAGGLVAMPQWSIAVAPLAHASGAMAGALAAAAIAWLGRPRPPRSSSGSG